MAYLIFFSYCTKPNWKKVAWKFNQHIHIYPATYIAKIHSYKFSHRELWNTAFYSIKVELGLISFKIHRYICIFFPLNFSILPNKLFDNISFSTIKGSWNFFYFPPIEIIHVVNWFKKGLLLCSLIEVKSQRIKLFNSRKLSNFFPSLSFSLSLCL